MTKFDVDYRRNAGGGKNSYPKGCIYCSARRTTKEHLFPSWLRGFQIDTPYVAHWITSATHTEDGETTSTLAEGKRHNWRGGLNTFSLRVTCDRCNNGWINATAESAREALVRLGSGISCTYDLSEQRRLASWITLFVMTSEFDNMQTVTFTSEQRSQFRIDRKPPEGTRIWVHGSWGTEWSLRHWHTAVRIDESDQPLSEIVAMRPNTQITNFGVGHAGFHVFSTDTTERLDMDGVHQLWPLTGNPLRVETAFEGFAIPKFGIAMRNALNIPVDPRLLGSLLRGNYSK
jgi:hypothetical protein